MSPRAPKAMEVKRLNMNLPSDLHAAFKSAAAAEGKQMTDVLMDFIKGYVKQHPPKQRQGGRSQ